MNKNKYIAVAKDVINLEIKALQRLRKNINKSFGDAVVKIASCQSKVILCGVGKSGIIANKISASLSSIGTPSFSLSANDCSHGNMGSISKKDVLILIRENRIELYTNCLKFLKTRVDLDLAYFKDDIWSH